MVTLYITVVNKSGFREPTTCQHWDSLQTGSPYGFFCFAIARGRASGGEPVMVLVRFEYLHSDAERKLLIGQFDLTHVK